MSFTLTSLPQLYTLILQLDLRTSLDRSHKGSELAAQIFDCLERYKISRFVSV